MTVRGKRGHAADPTTRVLLVTSHLPNPGREADLVLRSLGSDVIFDVVSVNSPANGEHSRAYGSQETTMPLAGFW